MYRQTYQHGYSRAKLLRIERSRRQRKPKKMARLVVVPVRRRR